MFFDSWLGLLRVAVIAPLAYLALVVILRISGKRTLAKLNAFDLVVTVALGSTLATIILSKTVALAEGVVAFILLAGMQYVVAWASVKSPQISALVKSEPTLLLHQGQFLHKAMQAQRVTREEVLSALRAQGEPNHLGVSAVVLETDGSMSVIHNALASEGKHSLEDIAVAR